MNVSTYNRHVFTCVVFYLVGGAASPTIAAKITGARLHQSEKNASQPEKDVVLELTLEEANGDTRIFAYEGDKAKPLESLGEATNNKLQVRLPIERLLISLAGKGRSLWLAAGEHGSDQKTPANLSPKVRFDFPGVDLEAQCKVSHKQGVQIIQQASNLLPGYHVVYSEYHADGTRGLPRVMRADGPPPYLLQSAPAGSSAQMTIQWKAAATDAGASTAGARQGHTQGPRAWLLYVENIDGSRSCTKLLEWNGAKFTSIREFQDTIPAPTDELVPVPDVTAMPLDRAGVLLARAGFHPIPVTPQSLAALPSTLFTPAWLRGRVVERQGLKPGEKAPQGSVVYLSIEGEESEILADARKSWIGPVPKGGLAGKTDPSPATKKTGGLEDKTKVDPLAIDTPSDEKKDDQIPEVAPQGPTGGLTGSADEGKADKPPGGLVDTTTVPTIPIDPKTIAEDENDDPTVDAADPTGGLQGTTEKASPKPKSGGLVDNTPVKLLQPPIENDLPFPEFPDDEPPPASASTGAIVFEPIELVPLVDVPDLMGMTLAEVKPALAKVPLKESHQEKVDENIDVVVVQDPKPGYQPAPEMVKLRFQVPVPNITYRAFRIAIEDLATRGLQSSVALKGHEKHGCIGQIPQAHTEQKPSTLPRGSVVQVKLAALMPDLRGKTLEAATALLWQDELETNIQPESRPSDIVTDQNPPPHSPGKRSIVPLGSTVQVQLGRAVPEVEKLAVSEAKQRLTEAGFTPRAPDQGGESATVLHQDPRPGAIVAISSDVTLGLQVTVPDVTGLALSEARTRLQDAGFESNASELADDADIVRGQKPKGGDTNASLGSTVELAPVMAKVPNVVGKGFDEANAELQDRARFVVAYDEKLNPEDRITAQLPRAGAELERGGRVRILSILNVPNVVGQEPQQGIDAIAAVNLEAEMELDWIDGDRIVRQDPAGGRKASPHSKVKLWFGREAPNLLGQSEEQARRTLEEQAIKGDLVRTIQEETADRSMDNRAIVFDQDPKPGRPIIRTVAGGTEMRLVMKNFVYVPPVMVRAFEGADTLTVDRWLKQDGLNGKILNPVTAQYTQNPGQANKKIVVWQSIPAGEMVRPGTEVAFRCVFYQYYVPPPEQVYQPHPRQLPPIGGGGFGGGGTIGGGGRGGGGGGVF